MRRIKPPTKMRSGLKESKVNILDVNTWNRQLLGQTFYSICGDKKIFIRMFALRATGLLMGNFMRC